MSLLFFHTVIEISGEIHDQLYKSARDFTSERHARDGNIREAVRNGPDAATMNDAVLALVADAVERVRAGGSAASYEEVVDWGLRAFSSYIRACVPAAAPRAASRPAQPGSTST